MSIHERRKHREMWHPCKDDLAIGITLTLTLACVWGLVAVYLLVQVYSP